MKFIFALILLMTANPVDSDDEILNAFDPKNVRRAVDAVAFQRPAKAPRRDAHDRRQQNVIKDLVGLVPYRVASLEQNDSAVVEEKVVDSHRRGGLRFNMDGFLRSVWGDGVICEAPRFHALREHAKAVGTSERSVIANGVVMASIIDWGQDQFFTKKLEEVPDDGFPVATKIWDEATLRMQVNREQMCESLGISSGDDLVEYRSARLEQKRVNVAPSFVLSTFQAQMHLRWGSKPTDQEMAIPTMKILFKNRAADAAVALECSSKPLRTSKLAVEFNRIKWGVVVVWPDSAATNKLLQYGMGEALAPDGLLFEGHCIGHQVCIIENGPLDTLGLIDAQYALASQLSLGSTSASMMAASKAVAEKTTIIYGDPPPGANQLTPLILKYTVLRKQLPAFYRINDNWDDPLE